MNEWFVRYVCMYVHSYTGKGIKLFDSVDTENPHENTITAIIICIRSPFVDFIFSSENFQHGMRMGRSLSLFIMHISTGNMRTHLGIYSYR